MFTYFWFRLLKPSKQVKYIKTHGVMLGARSKGGRQAYVYMFHSLFAEILFKDDNPESETEQMILMDGLELLHLHLERETKFYK